MDDPSDVRHPQGTGDVESDPSCLPRREPPAAPESGREVLPFDEGHDEVGLVAVGAGIKTGDDVRVTKDGRGERLAPESVGQVAVSGDLGSQDLDRDLALEADVGRAMDRRHPATTDDRPEPVSTTEERLGGRRPGRLGRLGRRGHAATIAETA